MKLPRWLLFALLAVLVTVGLLALRNRPVLVDVVRPQQQTLAEVLALSGRVHGVEESQLAPEVAGTLERLLVAEGQSVKKGQKLAELDLERLRGQLEQAEERVQVAKAQLAVASRKPLPSEIEQVRSEVEGQNRASSANLEKARQALLELERGPRIEQIEQARAVLREATALVEQEEREAQRQSTLAAQGAVSRQTAEQAATQAATAREQQRNAEARLAELQNGTRPEQLSQARQEVAAAQALLTEAERAGAARLEQILEQPRAEDVKLAQAQVGETLSMLKVSRAQLQQGELRAPYDGVVGKRLLRIGDQAGPNAPVLTFSSQPSLEIRVDVDESDRARLRLGQKAEIRANGYEDSFQAELAEMAPEVDSVRGTLEARLRTAKAPDWLIPGQTVDVNLILDQQKPRLVVPLTSVILRGDKAELAVIKDGTVHLQAVEISSPLQEGYLIRSGLQGGETLAKAPQGLTEGQKVRPREAK